MLAHGGDGDDGGAWLRHFRQEVDEKKEWMMWDREGYFEFLRGATGSVAGELRRRAAAAE
jgi:hypothetical protein